MTCRLLLLLLASLAAPARAGTNAEGLAFLEANKAKPGVITLPSGLQYKVLEEGTGPSPTSSDVALVGYKGALLDGTVFDENPQAPMPIDGVVPGFSEGLQKMKKGGKYKLWIPSELGYGAEDNGPIPGGSVLVFDVTLHDFKSKAELMQLQQQMMQQQGAMPQPGQ